MAFTNCARFSRAIRTRRSSTARVAPEQPVSARPAVDSLSRKLRAEAVSRQTSRRRRSPRKPDAVSRWRKARGADLYSGWPPSSEQQQQAKKSLAWLEPEYARTGHPYFACAAFIEAQHADLPIPNWVL